MLVFYKTDLGITSEFYFDRRTVGVKNRGVRGRLSYEKAAELRDEVERLKEEAGV